MIIGYIGPGPGLGMVGALIGLIATILAALGAVLFWPVRMMLRKMRGDEGEEAEEGRQGSQGEEEIALKAEAVDDAEELATDG